MRTAQIGPTTSSSRSVWKRPAPPPSCPLPRPSAQALGLQNRVNIRLIVEQSKVPVLVDAGVGAASDATIANRAGLRAPSNADAAIAAAKDPIGMARAMKRAVIAGRDLFAGRMPKKMYADPSSPLDQLISASAFLADHLPRRLDPAIPTTSSKPPTNLPLIRYGWCAARALTTSNSFSERSTCPLVSAFAMSAFQARDVQPDRLRNLLQDFWGAGARRHLHRRDMHTSRNSRPGCGAAQAPTSLHGANLRRARRLP